MRELFGMIAGWLVVTVAAWFAAFSLMCYWLGSLFPWFWTPAQRGIHLAIQFAFIAAYAVYTREKRR